MYLINKFTIDNFTQEILDEDCEGAVKAVGPRDKRIEGIFILI